jgi:hypothetical protein
MLNKETTPTSLTDWIKLHKEHQLYLLIAAILSIVLFTGFKVLYPFPNFFPDSFSYLDAAMRNDKINIWPIGYSQFLRLFSSVTDSDTALLFFQYIVLEASIAYLLLSVAFFFQPDKWITRILWGLIFIILQPLLLHISNFISSDAIFSALSITWATQLFWLIKRPTLKLMILHGLILVVAFMARYNALWYPIISAGILLWVRWPIINKLAATGYVLFLPLLFIWNTSGHYQKMTGMRQFSAFGGWQMAANAMYAYSHVKPEVPQDLPKRFQKIHGVVNHHMDSIQRLPTRPDNELGIYYLWDEQAPLKKYLRENWPASKADTGAVLPIPGFNRWSEIAPMYSAYGAYLIKKYPGAYFKYYLWPNLINYYAPSAEFLRVYNMGKDTIEPIATVWFKYENNKVHVRSKDKGLLYMEYYQPLPGIVNVLFVLGLIGFLVLGGTKKNDRYLNQLFIVTGILWTSNLAFSITASPIVLRYQLFPAILALTFGAVFIGFIINECKRAAPVISTGSGLQQLSGQEPAYLN